MLIGILGACSNNDENTTTAGGNKGPQEIGITFNFDGVEFPAEENDVEKKIEEITNTKLNIQALPSSTYGEKFPVALASGELPEVVSVGKDPVTLDAISGGVFWEIGPYLEQFPNLAKINPIIYDNISVEGKIYGLPKIRPFARNAFAYRQDWLKNLGLDEPKTIEEYYEVLKAFTHNDPDKNGKNDTIGLSATGVGALCVFFGAPNKWDEKDGIFIRDVLTDEYLEALKFERKLFEEGLMNKDFAAIDRPEWEGNLTEGKAGFIINTTNAVIAYEDRLKQHTPDATLHFFSILEESKGKRVASGGGNNGFIAFPKFSVESEEELLGIMKFFDTLAAAEGATVLQWGLEGVHHEIMDGKVKMIDSDKYQNEVAFPYRWPLGVVPPEENATEGEMHRLAKLEIEVTTDNENYIVNDPTLSLISQTSNQMGSQLETIITDANIKFVMGEIDEKGWKAEIEMWRERGGDKIAKEYAEAFAKLNK